MHEDIVVGDVPRRPRALAEVYERREVDAGVAPHVLRLRAREVRLARPQFLVGPPRRAPRGRLQRGQVHWGVRRRVWVQCASGGEVRVPCGEVALLVDGVERETCGRCRGGEPGSERRGHLVLGPEEGRARAFWAGTVPGDARGGVFAWGDGVTQGG